MAWKVRDFFFPAMIYHPWLPIKNHFNLLTGGKREQSIFSDNTNKAYVFKVRWFGWPLHVCWTAADLQLEITACKSKQEKIVLSVSPRFSPTSFCPSVWDCLGLWWEVRSKPASFYPVVGWSTVFIASLWDSINYNTVQQALHNNIKMHL